MLRQTLKKMGSEFIMNRRKDRIMLCRMLAWWRQKTGMWGIFGLWMPFFAFYVWLGKGFCFFPLLRILSGEYFLGFVNGEFARPLLSKIHVISNIHQSILKYMVLSIFFSITALPVCVFIRLISDVRSRRNYLAFALPFTLIACMALSWMTLPATLLIQYIRDMGLTPRRLMAAGIMISYFAIWIAAIVIMLRTKSTVLLLPSESKCGSF